MALEVVLQLRSPNLPGYNLNHTALPCPDNCRDKSRGVEIKPPDMTLPYTLDDRLPHHVGCHINDIEVVLGVLCVIGERGCWVLGHHHQQGIKMTFEPKRAAVWNQILCRRLAIGTLRVGRGLCFLIVRLCAASLELPGLLQYECE